MNGELTAADGSYSLNLPAGTYQVQAFFPPESVIAGQTVNYLNPEPQEVSINSSSPAEANFRFKDSDATLTGTVTLDGISQGAFISAYSANGGYNETTSFDGSYSLNVTQNDTWYIRAFYEDGNSVYLSDVFSIEMGSNSIKTKDISLEEAPFTIPDAVSTSFNCANAKKISLSNGTQISIPANAIKPSSIEACDSTSPDSNITLTISPTSQMSLQSKSVPIGVGYEITALDANGAEISNTFNSNVTITIPYSEQQIETSMGGAEVDESLLSNGYWDSSTSNWRNVSSEVLDTNNNELSISTNHFTLFTVIAVADPNSTADSDSDSDIADPVNSSSSTPQPTGCNKLSPGSKKPWLYAVFPDSSQSLKLYFTDADGPLDRYVLTYGTSSNSYQYGALDIGGMGTRTYIVNGLQPSTTYYFRIRAGNGCATGGWSNELSGTTSGQWFNVGLGQTFNPAEPLKENLELELDKQNLDKQNCEIYSTQARDSLWSIAQQVYGEGAQYQQLIDLNSEQYPSLKDSGQIDIGWKLRIKCEPFAEEDSATETESSGEVGGDKDYGVSETNSTQEKKSTYLSFIGGSIIAVSVTFFFIKKLLKISR